MRIANTSRPHRLAILPLAVLLLLASGGCAGRSTPPGADKYMGSVQAGGYLLLRWQEGLQIMLWHDVTGDSSAHSAGSTQDGVYVERGLAQSAEGYRVDWEIHTTDGRRAQVWIDGAPYDLADGNLFALATFGDGTTMVRQYQYDLSSVPQDHDGIVAFAAEDPVLIRYVGGGPTPD
jgi:hypothetical protein